MGATTLPPPLDPAETASRRGVFLACPQCGAKLFTSVDGIPDTGREKRCVRCLSRFRVLRTPDEIVVQFRRDGGGSLGVSAMVETRYPLSGGPVAFDAPDDVHVGAFQDLVQSAKRPPVAEDDPLAIDEVPIERRLRIDQVFGELSKGMPGPLREPRAPRVLTAKDLHARQATHTPRKARLSPARGPRIETGALLRVWQMAGRLTRLDLALIVSFAGVTLGALVGLTDAGFFGVRAWGRSPAIATATAGGRSHEGFSADQVRDLVNAAAAGQAKPSAERYRGTRELLPAGDYENLFVEDIEVTLRSTPAGAQVHRGLQVLGETPLVLRLRATEDVVELEVEKDGFAPEKLRFQGTANRAFDLPLVALGRSNANREKSPVHPRPTASSPRPPTPSGRDQVPPSGDFVIY